MPRPTTRVRWTDEEEARFARDYIAGVPVHKIAAEMRRTPTALRRKAKKLDAMRSTSTRTATKPVEALFVQFVLDTSTRLGIAPAELRRSIAALSRSDETFARLGLFETRADEQKQRRVA